MHEYLIVSVILLDSSKITLTDNWPVKQILFNTIYCKIYVHASKLVNERRQWNKS